MLLDSEPELLDDVTFLSCAAIVGRLCQCCASMLRQLPKIHCDVPACCLDSYKCRAAQMPCAKDKSGSGPIAAVFT